MLILMSIGGMMKESDFDTARKIAGRMEERFRDRV